MPTKEQARNEEQKATAAEAPDKQEKESGKGTKKKSKKEKAEGSKKRKRKPLLKIFLVLLLLAVLVSLGLSVYFDWLNLRTSLMNTLCKIGPEGHTYAATLQQREAEVSQLETDLAAQQEELQQRADKLIADENRLTRLKAELEARDKALTTQEIATTPIYRGELSEEKAAELKNLGKIYSNMSAETAATILPQLYGPADMASIIFYMDKTAAAELLTTLTPELSAQITTEMLRE